MVTGHPSTEYNGAYHRSDRRRFRNSDDMYCYHHEPKDLWILRNKHTPDQPNCNACIVSKDGPLPFGAQTWKLSPTAVGKPKGECISVHADSGPSAEDRSGHDQVCVTGSGFVDTKLTVKLLEQAPVDAAALQIEEVRSHLFPSSWLPPK